MGDNADGFFAKTLPPVKEKGDGEKKQGAHQGKGNHSGSERRMEEVGKCPCGHTVRRHADISVESAAIHGQTELRKKCLALRGRFPAGESPGADLLRDAFRKKNRDGGIVAGVEKLAEGAALHVVPEEEKGKSQKEHKSEGEKKIALLLVMKNVHTVAPLSSDSESAASDQR